MRYAWLVLCVLLFSACAKQPSPKARQAGLIYAQLGNTYLKEGHVARAQEKLLRAYQLAPHQLSVVLALANFYAKERQRTRAQWFFEQAFKIDASSPRLLNNYGVFLCQKKSARLAIDYLSRAANSKGYPRRALALRNLKLCRQRLGQKKS